MKKIVFLILFLTGVFPVFNNDGLYLESYNSYGQGELDEVEIVNCTGITTTIDYETDQFIDYLDCEEDYDYDLKECVAGTDCIIRTEYKEPGDEDDDEDCLGETCPSGFEMDSLCNCEEIVQPCPNPCPEGYSQTLDCGCVPIPPPCPITSCSSGYVLVNCNCVQQQTQPPNNSTTNEGDKPKTKQQFDQLIADTSDNYNISKKTNQIITTSDGITHTGTLTKFKNDQGHIFYYFTPNTSDGRFIEGMYYRIPDSQGSTSVSGNTGGSGSVYTTATYYSYDLYDYPIGNGYVVDPTGAEISITILPNDTVDTVINTCVNCILNAPDPDASQAGGVSVADAKHLQNDILNILNKSPKFDKFKALIKRGPKDNKAFFSKIPQDKLDEALNDLDEGDQKVFATIVANTINSDKSMKIQYFNSITLLKTVSGVVSSNYNLLLNAVKLHPQLETAFINTGDGFTSRELLDLWGGGITAKYNGTIVSALDTTHPFYDESKGLHEFFGHGRPLSIETATTIHNQDDAILFENLVWRLLGKPERQRNGEDHYQRKIIPNYNTALPSFR